VQILAKLNFLGFIQQERVKLFMTVTKRVFLIISLLTTLTIIFKVSAASTTPMSNAEITINDSKNNSQVFIKKGNIFIVKLLTNPGTGYSWQIIKNNPDQLKPLGDSILEPLESKAPGASENQVFRFSAQKSGSTMLELHYLRPWERNIPPLKTYQINLQID
jgi:inhibitor of cysteine peptidase